MIAPSRIPRRSGDRIKTDRRDAETLAQLYRAGELTPVYVPTPEDEALRDLVRAREDSKQSLRRAKQQLGAFLLRRNLIFSGRTPWSKAHFKWLADLTMEHPAQQIVLQEYVATICTCQERVNRITKQIHELSEQSPLKPLIDALAFMRGISSLIATIVAAELGDLSRFDNPGHLMSYVGLIPSEHSSGPKIRKGAITKTGNGHVRKALVEAAQAYRLPARKSRAILKRHNHTDNTIRTACAGQGVSHRAVIFTARVKRGLNRNDAGVCAGCGVIISNGHERIPIRAKACTPRWGLQIDPEIFITFH